MKVYTAIVEWCPDTGLYVGYVPGFPGAHSQGKTLDELQKNLKEVIEMLLEGCYLSWHHPAKSPNTAKASDRDGKRNWKIKRGYFT